MICPNCNSQIETRGKFCPECGHELPQTPAPSESAPPPAPEWAQTVPAPAVEATPVQPGPAAEVPPPPPPAPQWAQQVTPPPPSPAPWAAQTPPPPPPAQWVQPAPGAPQWGQVPPAGYYVQPVAAARPAAGGLGALLALAGGAVAIGSAWLPWMTMGDQWFKGIDATSADGGLANGYYLVAAGAVAAVCGLLLLLGTSPSARQLLAAGAIAGGIGVCAVEVAAYMKVNDSLNQYGGAASALGIAVGWGIYVGAAGGALAVVGGLMGLTAKAGPAARGASQANLLLGLIAVAVIAVGGILAWPQIQKQINGSQSSPSGLVVIPTARVTAGPTGKATAKPTTAPTSAPSFMTSGYTSAEKAMNQYVTDQGYTYGGDCASVSSGSDYCSSMVDKLETGAVYAIGGVDSEAEVYVLLEYVGGKWYVADVASATGTPPWH